MGHRPANVNRLTLERRGDPAYHCRHVDDAIARCAPALILISAAGCSHSTQPAAATGKFEDLGAQITSTTIQGTTFAKLPDARDVVCTVVRGQPAKLLVFDVKTGSLLHRLALGTADGGWNATTATDGSVLHQHGRRRPSLPLDPRRIRSERSRPVGPEQTFAWDVCRAPTGEVFVSTYPGCNVIRYHPKDGFKDVGKGAVAPGENYARGLTYDPVGGKVYIAVGAHAHLIELDPKTGAKRNIVPPKYKDKKFCYSVEIAGGSSSR
jgi:hypothetical protein